MFYLPNKILFSLLFLILNSSAYAAKQQVLDIKAQYLLLDENNGVSLYKGNVILKKGTLSIKADTVTLYHEDKKLTKAMIVGSPADVHHKPDNEDKVHSQAKNMEFFVNEDRLVLKGQAFVDQGNRHFSGEFIEYDTRQRIITAAGKKISPSNDKKVKNTPPKSRVHVIIGPTDIDTVEENKE